jgi:hypothetical protein
MNPYSGFKHHGILVIPNIAAICAGDTHSIIQYRMAMAGNEKQNPNRK